MVLRVCCCAAVLLGNVTVSRASNQAFLQAALPGSGRPRAQLQSRHAGNAHHTSTLLWGVGKLGSQSWGGWRCRSAVARRRQALLSLCEPPFGIRIAWGDQLSRPPGPAALTTYHAAGSVKQVAHGWRPGPASRRPITL
jgi:hypothetical protein